MDLKNSFHGKDQSRQRTRQFPRTEDSREVPISAGLGRGRSLTIPRRLDFFRERLASSLVAELQQHVCWTIRFVNVVSSDRPPLSERGLHTVSVSIRALKAAGNPKAA